MTIEIKRENKKEFPLTYKESLLMQQSYLKGRGDERKDFMIKLNKLVNKYK